MRAPPSGGVFVCGCADLSCEVRPYAGSMKRDGDLSRAILAFVEEHSPPEGGLNEPLKFDGDDRPTVLAHLNLRVRRSGSGTVAKGRAQSPPSWAGGSWGIACRGAAEMPEAPLRPVMPGQGLRPVAFITRSARQPCRTPHVIRRIGSSRRRSCTPLRRRADSRSPGY